MLRPQLAATFTVVPGDDVVWLISGEDVRFALRGDAVGRWLPAVLAACDGARTVDELVAQVPAAHRDEARALITGLAGERLLVDGGALAAHQPAPVAWQVEGSGRLADALRARAPSGGGIGEPAARELEHAGDVLGSAGGVRVLAQDTLELGAALAVNRQRLAEPARWLWASIGPVARAFVGPLLLPDTGPCLECLIDHFRLRSPVPELYDRIVAHPGPFAPGAFEPAALGVVSELVAWKLALVDRLPADAAPAALYALHVVEVATLEVSSHRVLINPECPACATRGT